MSNLYLYLVNDELDRAYDGLCSKLLAEYADLGSAEGLTKLVNGAGDADNDPAGDGKGNENGLWCAMI